MNTYIYDTRKIFWPQNASADKIPISVESDTEISDAKNVQDAIQMLVNYSGGNIIGKLPDPLDAKDSTLNATISALNQIISALNTLKKE